MTLSIDITGGSTVTATNVTGLSFPAGEMTFYGTIGGITKQWTFMSTQFDEMRRV